jgi:hypothetical protein
VPVFRFTAAFPLTVGGTVGVVRAFVHVRPTLRRYSRTEKATTAEAAVT